MKKIKIICTGCKNISYKELRRYNAALKSNRKMFCSKQCVTNLNITGEKIECANCKTSVIRTPGQLKKVKNSFCSRSCAATYNNLHKTTGNRRSKLEIWLEEKLIPMYPNLKILFNDKTVINSELDIYIPSLKLAFELNGIYHYEPIHGQNKFGQIQNNDKRKFQACIEHNIELCIIDTSQMKYFKELNCLKYLDIIANILNLKLSAEGDLNTIRPL